MYESKKLFQDCIDNCYYPIEEGTFLYSLDIRLQEIVKRQHPDLGKDAFISNKNLTYFRLLFLEEIIDKANRKNDCVREAVCDAAKHQGYTALDVQDQLIERLHLDNESLMMSHVLAVHGRSLLPLFVLWELGWL